jgi:hypothetical protein
MNVGLFLVSMVALRNTWSNATLRQVLQKILSSKYAIPVSINGSNGIAPFYRIKDTTENRDALRAALAEYNEKRLLTLAELDENIQDLRQKIKEIVLPTLR